MSTRILSAFNLMKRVGFVFLFLGGTVHAQPLPDVLWDHSGDGNHTQFGYRIYSLGDQNDDGYADWAVNAIGEYNESPENEARFLLFHGGNPPEATPYMSFISDPDIYLRHGGQSLGDINGDGYQDWGIEVTFVTAPDSQITRIYLGGPESDTNPDYVLDSRPLDSWIDPLGDFNGDGYDDIYHYETNPNDILDVYFGSADFDTFPDWVRYNPNNQNIFPTVTGDFNGDGYGDFIAGPLIPERGFYFGGPEPDTLPRQSWGIGSLGGAAADMNGDGRDDIVTRLQAGASVFFGSDIVSDTPNATLNFAGCPDGSVDELNGIGDFNDDGYDDVMAIIWHCDLANWGRMGVYLGGPWINTDPVFTIEGREPPLNLIGIFTSKALGDVDGDGVDDFAVGCVNDNNDGRRGRVVIFAGDTTYHVPIGKVGPVVPVDLALSIYPNPVNGMATLDIISELAVGQVGIIVYNLLGQTVDRFTVNASYQSQFSYDVSRLASGNYIVQAYTNTSIFARKLVVLK